MPSTSDYLALVAKWRREADEVTVTHDEGGETVTALNKCANELEELINA